MKRRAAAGLILMLVVGLGCVAVSALQPRKAFAFSPPDFVRAGERVKFEKRVVGRPLVTKTNFDAIYRVEKPLWAVRSEARKELLNVGYSEVSASADEVRFEHPAGKYVTLLRRDAYATIHFQAYEPLNSAELALVWIQENL